jgi:hypothetical protein
MNPHARRSAATGKVIESLGRTLVQSWFISVVLGVAAFLLLPFRSEPYMIRTERAFSVAGKSLSSSYYARLGPSDGNDLVDIRDSLDGFAGVRISKPNEMPLDQWNFSGRLFDGSFVFEPGDHDRDGLMEIVILTLDKKEILLNIVEPYGNPSLLVKSKLVDTIWTKYPDMNLGAADGKFYDLNKDGDQEFVFILASGFSKQPRKIYAYDFVRDSLWSSPFSGSVIHSLNFADLDHDGFAEITGTTSAAYNYDDEPVIYPDSVTWLMIYDHHLNWKVPPVAFGKKFTTLVPIFSNSPQGPVRMLIQAAESNGEIIKNRYLLTGLTEWEMLPDIPEMRNSRGDPALSSVDPNYWAIIGEGNRPLFFDCDGNLIRKDIKMTSAGLVRMENSGLGLEDFHYCVMNRAIPNQLVFYNAKGLRLVTMNLSVPATFVKLCWVGATDQGARLQVQTEIQQMMLLVSKNPWQYVQYLILLGCIGVFFGFISLIRFIQSKQIAQNEKTRNEILELQLRSVKNQLDPHFTFNALNSLAALSMKGDSDGVDQFIGYFSHLLRSHFNSSDRVLVTLNDEIEFIVNYAELQRIRFDQSFRLELDIGQNVNLDRKIPKMLIQTHIENSIIHGLRPRTLLPDANAKPVPPIEGVPQGSGIVRLTIREDEEYVRITVEDNGVGRGQSTVSSFEIAGKGLRALDKIIESVKQLYGMEITQEVEDLFSGDGKPAGTRVRILIEA